MEKREVYLEKAHAQIKEWDAKLDLLNAKAEKASADMKIELLEQIETVKQQKTMIKEQLNEIKEAGEDVWEEIKDKLDSAQGELHELIHKIFLKKESQSTETENPPIK